MTTHWHLVWNEAVDGRPLSIEREDGRDCFRVHARQTVHDEGIAYQDGGNYVHVSPSSPGEPVEGDASSMVALAELLREMHFGGDVIDHVLASIEAAG